MAKRRVTAQQRAAQGGRPIDPDGRPPEYVPVPGSRVKQEEATDVGRVIDKLILERRGTAENLREEARKKRSPAHKWFIWDDHEAAEVQRLDQARRYFRSIAIVIEDVDRPVPAFQRIVYEDDEGQESSRYESMLEVRDDEVLMRQSLDAARKDLFVWLRRYRRYRTLARRLGILDEVFDALENEFEASFVHKDRTEH